MTPFIAGAESAVRRCADVLTALRTADPATVSETLRRHGEHVEELTDAEVARMTERAAPLRAVARAETAAVASQELNAVLTTCAPPRLTAHDSTQWHLHVDATDDAAWADWFTASSALALAIILAETQQPPLAICAAPGCGNPFVRHGRGRSRRYCTTTCATRARVAEHRHRTTEPNN